MSAKFEFGVFLSRDAMLARYMPSSCVRLCGVDVAYRRMSDWTRLQWDCTASTRSVRVHFLPWMVATSLFPNDFEGGLVIVVIDGFDGNLSCLVQRRVTSAEPGR